MQWIVEDLLHLYDRFKPQHSIVIGINYTKDFYVSKDLMVKIEQIFSSESIIIQKNYMEECDIIVSDCPLEHLPPHIKKNLFIGQLCDTARMEKSNYSNCWIYL